MEIQGKSVIVTGASTGIGRAAAQMFAERGAAKVVIADINPSDLTTLADIVHGAGAEPIQKIVDVSSADNVIRLFQETEAETGGLDIIFNNAGIMTGEPDFPDTRMDRMLAVIHINLIAMMVGTRVGIDLMRARKMQGVIINTASVAAFAPVFADPAYAASKSGILAFTQSCKPVYDAHGIRVVAICPGITNTKLWPSEAEWAKPLMAGIKYLQPADIAEKIIEIVEGEGLAGEYVIIGNEPKDDS